jgi:hypothetical protein
MLLAGGTPASLDQSTPLARVGNEVVLSYTTEPLHFPLFFEI